MDKYGTGNDPYCLPGTNVLRNKLDIVDAFALEQAERDLTTLASENIEFRSPPYDLAFLQHLHGCLFADVYSWAGEIRTTDITKGTTRFCTVTRIKPEADKLFQALEQQDWLSRTSREQLIHHIAEFCGDLNMIHPFREGNGRVMRLWCDFIIINAGFEVNWEIIETDLWLKASIDSVTCDFQAMQAVFNQCIGNRFTHP